MKRNKKDKIPLHFESYEEAGEFWNSHDLTDYLNQTKEVDLKFTLKRRFYYVSIIPEIAKKIKQVAEEEGVSIETITNLWLQEKLQEKSKSR